MANAHEYLANVVGQSVRNFKGSFMSLSQVEVEVEVVAIDNGKIMARIMCFDTFSAVQIPNSMLTEEFVTSLNVHLHSNPKNNYRAAAMLNVDAETVEELFDGAYFRH
jgi:hypothetical protein